VNTSLFRSLSNTYYVMPSNAQYVVGSFTSGFRKEPYAGSDMFEVLFARWPVILAGPFVSSPATVAATSTPSPSPSTQPFLTSKGLPDLTVTGLTLTPTSPFATQPVALNVRIENVGFGDSVPCNVAASTGGSVRLDAIAVGGKVDVVIPWQATRGSNTVKVMVDDGNVIPESSETNNEKAIQVFVRDPPDLFPISISPSMSPLTPTFIITGGFRNGGTTSLDSVTVSAYMDGNLAGTKKLAAKADLGTDAGGFGSLPLPSQGIHSFTLVVDEPNAIFETNETNNTLTRQYDFRNGTFALVK
jgi:hypothetical protein